jgi:hypothetical protein
MCERRQTLAEYHRNQAYRYAGQSSRTQAQRQNPHRWPRISRATRWPFMAPLPTARIGITRAAVQQRSIPKALSDRMPVALAQSMPSPVRYRPVPALPFHPSTLRHCPPHGRFGAIQTCSATLSTDCSVAPAAACGISGHGPGNNDRAEASLIGPGVSNYSNAAPIYSLVRVKRFATGLSPRFSRSVCPS